MTYFSPEERAKEEQHLSANHVKVQENDDLDEDIELAKAPKTLKDRNRATLMS